jgi:hypothetical protein
MNDLALTRKTSRTALSCRSPALPAGPVPLSEPLLLVGETSRDFEIIRRMMIDDIEPRANIEEL